MKIKKEEYDALPETVKALFAADGDEFISQTEADKALKAKNDELLREVKTKSDVLRQFEGLNADEAKKALAEMSKLEEKKLADKGKFEEILEKYRTDYEGKLTAAQSEKDQLISNLKRERLTNFLIGKGILPDRAKFALTEIGDTVELVSNADGFTLKKKDGIGDAKELDTMVEGLKQTSAFLFAPEGASGSGATGSNGKGTSDTTQPGYNRLVSGYSQTTT